MRRLWILAVLLAAVSSPAAAEVVEFTNGHLLTIDSYELVEDKVVLTVGGGKLIVPLASVRRIGDDEVIPAPPGFAGGKRPPTVLDFRRRHKAPETPFGKEIFRTARRYGINPNLLAAIAEVRSGFDEKAVSENGALGLLQIFPQTARKFGFAPEDLLNAETNLQAGARYVNWLRKWSSDDLDVVLAGFAVGAAAVRQHQGVPPDPATREFIARVYEILGVERAEAS